MSSVFALGYLSVSTKINDASVWASSFVANLPLITGTASQFAMSTAGNPFKLSGQYHPP
jgi:hypothetical protein